MILTRVKDVNATPAPGQVACIKFCVLLFSLIRAKAATTVHELLGAAGLYHVRARPGARYGADSPVKAQVGRGKPVMVAL